MNKQRRTNSIRKTEVTVLALVHLYFYYFHAWIPTTDKQRFLLNFLKNYQYVSLLIVFLTFIVPFSYSLFKLELELLYPFYILIAVLLGVHLIFVIFGFFILAPNSPQAIITRLNQKLNLNLDIHDKRFQDKNHFLKRYELEKVWVELYLKDIPIDNLIQLVERNLSNRKPSSRDPEVAFRNLIHNPYIINSLVIVFTVLLTIVLNPISDSITDDNFFQILTSFTIFGFYFWVSLIIIALCIKSIFFILEVSFEYTSKDKKVIIWRYELLIDMLARHEKVEITKPKI